METNRMLSVALLGGGAWGRTLVRSVQGKSDRIRFVSIVTRTPASAAAFAAETALPVHDDYAAALADPSIAGIVIATPHSQHIEQIERAAAAGKHVLVEKPLALTRADVARAYDACARAGVVLALGHNRRFLPAVTEIETLVREGALGTLLLLEANFSGPSGWRHAASSWRASAAESPWGGMTGKGLHMSDLMIMLAGPIVEVDALSTRRVLDADLDDTTITRMRFASGAAGTLATLTATADMFRLGVYGSRGFAELCGNERLRIKLNDGTERIVDFPPLDIERAELESFADTVAGRRAFPVTREEAENNIAYLEGIGRSIASKGQVPVEP
jgi:predicted dehydrogenase